MLDRQDSAGSINVILHMNTEDNIQAVPIAGKSTCQNRKVYFPNTIRDMGQHSTVDLSQIPLTVNSEFFMDSDDGKDLETPDVDQSSFSEENGRYVSSCQRFGILNQQTWSSVSNSSTQTFTDNLELNKGLQTATPSRAFTDNLELNKDLQTATTSRTFTDNFQFNAGNNPDLQKATNEALQSGTILPLVKEELKCSIQSKRLKEGKSELTVQFEDPKPDILTPEEEVKVELRRTQNREAARRFRDRQKRKTDELQKECRKLEAENSRLRSEIVQLRKEKGDLSTSFRQHLSICPLGGTLNRGFYSEVT